MTNLYVARHGETEWNKERRLQGWKDAPLTKLGEAQAKPLGERLKKTSLDIAYTSPLGRVRSTAKIALEDISIPLKENERLKEINLGEWDGMRSKDARERDPELYRKALEEPDLFNPPWGENYYDLRERVVEAAKDILSNNRGKNILLVSHGLASKTLISYFEERPVKDLRKPPTIRECSLSLIKFDEDNFKDLKKCEIVLYGDTSHLDDL